MYAVNLGTINGFNLSQSDLCGQTFLEAMSKSKIYAKNIFGIDLAGLNYQDKTRYCNGIPYYVQESYPIQISFKTGAVHKIGNVSLTTLEQKVKSSEELTDEINSMIKRYIKSSCVGTINDISHFNSQPDSCGHPFFEAMNKSKAYAKSIFGIDLADFNYHFNQGYEDIPFHFPEKYTIQILFKTGAVYKIGNVSLRTLEQKVKSSKELTNEIEGLINKFIRNCCVG